MLTIRILFDDPHPYLHPDPGSVPDPCPHLDPWPWQFTPFFTGPDPDYDPHSDLILILAHTPSW